MALIIGQQLLPADRFVALRIKWSEEQTSALKGNLALRQVPFFGFPQASIDDFVRTAEAAQRGERKKKETGVYFTSLEAFRKALTPQRFNLLRLIREGNPASLHELARLAQRNIKNVSEDVKYLSRVGLIELNNSANRTSARVNYDKIMLEIAV